MKTKTKYHHFIAVFILFFAVVQSCSTEKDAWINRTYHNTTAHYNGYFNAGEIIKETMTDFELNRQENYAEIIPLFIYANDEESKAFYSPMDTAVSKCETVIARNSMPKQKVGQFKNVEWCKWIDDNWLVIGQAQFYKRDFEGAIEKFSFIEKQYKTASISHTAKLWRAKTLIELEQFDEAKEVLDELQNVKEELKEQKEDAEKAAKEAKEKAKKRSSSRSRKRKKSKSKSKKKEGPTDEIPALPKKFEQDLLPVVADLYLRQKQYKEAEEALRASIEVTKKRKFKTRQLFILAQLLQEVGGEGASELYAEVVKRNPVYDMAFQAKINRALAYSGGDSKSIKAQLLKMLKDDKNIDYHDQIYYALGDIELRAGNRPEGIAYLEQSVMVSKANKVQKSKSFLRLGKLYYIEKNYTKAQQYYDSTMAVLPKDHFEYESISETNKSLSELVENLNIVQKGDSLTSLCKLSDKELLSKIDDIIEQKKLEKEAEDERRRLLAMQNANATAPSNTGTPSGTFWAFDANLKKIGFNDFKSLWGDRKLEDNWRRSDKSSLDFDGGEEEKNEESEEFTVDYYLKTLPCNDNNKLAQIDQDVMNSLYKCGEVYKTKLDNQVEAKKSFEALSRRFLPNEKAIAGLYQLYLMTNGEEMKKYKQTILNDYPNSEYAKIIKDPNYKQKAELAGSKNAEDYKTTYSYYTQKQYDKVIELSNKVIQSEKENVYKCKYYYLKAVAVGQKYANSDSLRPLENALSDVVQHCKGDEVYEPAKALLDKLRNVQSVSDAQAGKSTYVYATDATHFFVLVFPNNKGSINKAKAKVSDFNKASFSTKNLSVKSSFVDQDTQVVVTRSFKDKEDAMDYYVAFKVNKKQVKDYNQSFDFFIITETNFSSLYVEKNIEEYVTFFNKNYLQ
ncbi:MAG: tetratricopeptide repeat protein [Flavobacteriales bacterium]|nr:tetratricopeptide repeat protein [Flavobacteriales bacterium]